MTTHNYQPKEKVISGILYDNPLPILLISLIGLGVLIGYLYTQSVYGSNYYDASSKSLFKEYATHEENHGFFSNASDIEITLYFPESIEAYDFENMVLYYNDQVKGSGYRILGVEEDHISLALTQYIDHFNKIKVKHKGKDLFLYTGTYSFEHLEFELSKTYFFSNKHSFNGDLTYQMTMGLHLDLRKDGMTLTPIMPQKITDENLLESNVFELKEKNFSHHIEVNERALKAKDLSRLSFDVLYVLTPIEGSPLKSIVLKSNVPFQLR